MSMEALIRAAVPEPLPAFEALEHRKGLPVCIIGGGGTGAALAYDLALRGFDVTLVEKGELTSGTTGRHHGQLHCGARYAWADRNIAAECYAESLVLSRIARGCMEYNGGLFVAKYGEDEALVPRFIECCAEAGIPASPMDGDAARRLEPGLAADIRAAVLVPDGSFDAYRLAMMFVSAARSLGAKILPWHEAVGFERHDGRVTGVWVRDLARSSGGEMLVEAVMTVNAGGAWAAMIGARTGLKVPVLPAAGTMVAVKDRLCCRVVSRLRPPGDGDILVPQRGLTIIGSTQRFAESPEGLLPEMEEIEFLRKAADGMLPGFSKKPVYAAWTAARPLAGARSGENPDGRSLSRDFEVIDHEYRDGVKGLFTVTGGKATVLRAMAEKAADVLCARLGVAAECRTDRYRLPSWRGFHGGRP